MSGRNRNGKSSENCRVKGTEGRERRERRERVSSIEILACLNYDLYGIEFAEKEGERGVCEREQL